MSSSESSGPPPLTPPSLPNSGAWQPTLLEPVRLDGKIVSGTEGIVLGDVEQEVLKGGRFVVYSYNFSVLVMSFRRSSGIHFLRPGNDGAARALGYTLFSLLFGPWGFPWGLIWTPVSVFTNLAGGKDVTAPLLGAFFGPDRAASVMAARRKPSAGWGLMLLRTLFIAAPLTLIGTIWWDAQASQAEELKLTRSPGYAAFNAADTQAMGSTGSGNTAEARETARQIADGMKHFLDQATTHTGGGTPPSHACGVWYEFRDDHCVVLMRVPGLASYNADARKVIANAAWMDVLTALQRVPSIKNGTSLAVGLRGDYAYDNVMNGKVTSDPEAKPEGSTGPGTGRAKLIEGFQPEVRS